MFRQPDLSELRPPLEVIAVLHERQQHLAILRDVQHMGKRVLFLLQRGLHGDPLFEGDVLRVHLALNLTQP